MQVGNEGQVMMERVTRSNSQQTGRVDDEASNEVEDLQIRLMGSFHVAVGTRIIAEAEWYLRKPRNLLKLLALTPGHRLHRGPLIDLLWPDLDQERGVQNLYKTLHVARRVLEPTLGPNAPSSYLHRNGELLVLDPPGSLWIDVDAFRKAAEQARRKREPADYEAALGLYGGELLPEDRYEEWAMRPREEVQSLQLTLLLDLARVREQRGEIGKAIDVLEQVVAIDPAHARTISAAVQSGCTAPHL